jgi:flavin reductase (DIM6/NTAB) family NADH-FMN oxidoreductase RutF
MMAGTLATGAVPPAVFRDAMAAFAAQVTIVTCYGEDGTPRGLTASSVTSLSMDPPLLLVCVNRGASTHQALVDAPWFCVNLLSAGQEDLAMRFAGPAQDRFRGLGIGTGPAPGIDAAAAVLTCSNYGIRDGGDHTILIGQITAVDVQSPGTAGGLVWHQRQFAHAAPARPR